jgi:hypothetical protein
MGAEAFMGGFRRTFYGPFSRNGYGNYSYAVRAAENTLSEHYKMGYLLL